LHGHRLVTRYAGVHDCCAALDGYERNEGHVASGNLTKNIHCATQLRIAGLTHQPTSLARLERGVRVGDVGESHWSKYKEYDDAVLFGRYVQRFGETYFLHLQGRHL